jgi:hypothetical protein
MPRVYVSSVIDAPAAKVWERVRDFNGLPRWHPRSATAASRMASLPTRWAASATSTCRTATASARSCWVSRLRHVLHLLDPRKPDAADRLYRHAAFDAGHRWRPHLRRVERRIRLRRGRGRGPGHRHRHDVFQAGFARAQAADGGLALSHGQGGQEHDHGRAGGRRCGRSCAISTGMTEWHPAVADSKSTAAALRQGRLRAALSSRRRLGTARAAADPVGCSTWRSATACWRRPCRCSTTSPMSGWPVTDGDRPSGIGNPVRYAQGPRSASWRDGGGEHLPGRVRRCPRPYGTGGIMTDCRDLPDARCSRKRHGSGCAPTWVEARWSCVRLIKELAPARLIRVTDPRYDEIRCLGRYASGSVLRRDDVRVLASRELDFLHPVASAGWRPPGAQHGDSGGNLFASTSLWRFRRCAAGARHA